MTPREFALQVAQKLQDHGYQGLWAGGCVRDQLLGRQPKDYDVATDATPEKVRAIFGKRKTIAIGAAFGVITVIGNRQSGNIEVATFRRDSTYSDGRRPDSVQYTDAREDAIRRDFTINGMFFDPVSRQIIDFVDGKADIECRVVRAIGDPHERINEDKLRMLRAVRFTAAYKFELDPETLQAIQQHAADIHAVSAERIGAEMRRMLRHSSRAVAVDLLKECRLLKEVLQDGELLYKNRGNWRTRLRWLEELSDETEFEQAAAILLSRLIKLQGVLPTVERWKLTNAEAAGIQWIEDHLLFLSRAHQLPWSEIQPLLIHKFARMAVQVAEIQFGAHHEGIKACRERLSRDPDELNPKPLIDGSDLKQLGLKPGPDFKRILDRVRALQLDGEIQTRESALKLAKNLPIILSRTSYHRRPGARTIAVSSPASSQFNWHWLQLLITALPGP